MLQGCSWEFSFFMKPDFGEYKCSAHGAVDRDVAWYVRGPGFDPMSADVFRRMTYLSWYPAFYSIHYYIKLATNSESWLYYGFAGSW